MVMRKIWRNAHRRGNSEVKGHYANVEAGEASASASMTASVSGAASCNPIAVSLSPEEREQKMADVQDKLYETMHSPSERFAQAQENLKEGAKVERDGQGMMSFAGYDDPWANQTLNQGVQQKEEALDVMMEEAGADTEGLYYRDKERVATSLGLL